MAGLPVYEMWKAKSREEKQDHKGTWHGQEERKMAVVGKGQCVKKLFPPHKGAELALKENDVRNLETSVLS